MPVFQGSRTESFSQVSMKDVFKETAKESAMEMLGAMKLKRWPRGAEKGENSVPGDYKTRLVESASVCDRHDRPRP